MIVTSSRRWVRLTTAASVVAVLALAGCGRTAQTEQSGPVDIDDSAASGTVTVWAPDGDASALESILADFTQANPDLDLDVTLVPSDEYNTKLQTAISSGTAPDIAQVYTEAQTPFLASGAFAPVPEGLVDPSSFFSGVWEAGEYDGQTYSVPWYAYTYALIYRSDFAEAADATPPSTWEETLDFWRALEAGGAEKGFGADVGWDTYTGQGLARYAVQAGASLLSDDGTTWEIDTPEVTAAIEQYTQPYLEGVASIDAPQFLDAQPYFVQGKTGSLLSGPWVIAALDDVAGEQGWTQSHVATAVAAAGPDNRTGNLGGGSWVVSKDSQNQAAAWKVVRELAQPETQVALFDAYGSMPAVQSAWESDAISSNSLYDAFFEQLTDVRPMPAVTTWPELSTEIGAELEAVARGNEDAATAAANLQARADSLGTGR